MTKDRYILAAGLTVGLALALAGRGQEVDRRVLEADAHRVAVVEKIKPTVVAIFDRGGMGGGSGVLVSKEGYALTNFHVVEGAGPLMKCGLSDGYLYDAVLVGLDKVGDVALVKLQPRTAGQELPAAVLGDSDKLKAGDWSLALGNPFLLATDFQPTVTYGLVSGIHRYQYPSGTLLEYTDCIQIDTSINPGNSGGPLFSMDGELVGINGRGSFEKRGRVNSGVGYAISINQIKNFLGHLRAGLDTDHATLGARVTTAREDEGGGARLVFSEILDNSDAARRGLQNDDQLVEFAGRPMTSVNQYKNVLGLFPRGWRVPLTYRHDDERHEVLVRLMQLRQQDSGDEEGKPKPKGPGPRPVRPKGPPPNPELAKMYEPKPGFANYYFNKVERDRLLAGFRKHGDFTGLKGDWAIDAEAVVKERRTDASVRITGGDKEMVRLKLGALDYELDPLQFGQNVEKLKDPPGSGGLLTALYQYRRLLTLGPAGFKTDFHHGGSEPLYPPRLDGSKPDHLADLRVDTEVLLTEEAAVPVKWYFSPKDQTLLGFEVTVESTDDPCEVYLSDYRMVDGRRLPYRIEVRHGDQQFAVLNVKSYTFGK